MHSFLSFFSLLLFRSSSNLQASRPQLILHPVGLPTQRPQSGSYVNINTESQWVKLLLIPADTDPLLTNTCILVINPQMKGTGVTCLSQTGAGRGTGWYSRRWKSTSRLLGRAWMLKRHLGILQNTLSQPLSILRWLACKPSWQESLPLLPGTSPCPCVLGWCGMKREPCSSVALKHWGLQHTLAAALGVCGAGEIIPSLQARVFGRYSSKRSVWNC